MVGAVRGIDPETGEYFDDTKRYIDALTMGDADKRKIFEENARRVYPRIGARLTGSRSEGARACQASDRR
jgi:4-oxalmesaconate hydratase